MRSGRELVRDLVDAARMSPFSRCVYCGHRSYGRACAAHKDLPQLETAQSPPRENDLAVSGTGSDRKAG